VVFRNGLVLRMLPTPFMKDHSSLSLHVGGGSDALDDEEYVVAQFAVDADKRSGFGRLTAEEAGRLFRSTGYGASYNLGSESLQISGRGETADMRGILQAMWTQFRDPHIEEKDRQEKLRELAIADAARDKDVSSAAGTAGRRLFFGDSVRINPLTAQQGAGISLQQMRDALKKLYAGGGGVLNIVGDFDPEEARRLVAAYFGAPEVQWQPAAAPVHAFVPRFPAPDSRTEHVVVDAADCRIPPTEKRWPRAVCWLRWCVTGCVPKCAKSWAHRILRGCSTGRMMSTATVCTWCASARSPTNLICWFPWWTTSCVTWPQAA
jgi:zinc protease